MGIHAQWDNEAKTAIHAAADGEWDWDDASAVTMQINEMIECVDHRVDLIIGDETKRRDKIPPNAVTHWRDAYRNLHPKAGLIIIIGVDPFVKTLLNVVIKLTRSDHRIRMVDTFAEARALVNQRQLVSKSA